MVTGAGLSPAARRGGAPAAQAIKSARCISAGRSLNSSITLCSGSSGGSCSPPDKHRSRRTHTTYCWVCIRWNAWSVIRWIPKTKPSITLCWHTRCATDPQACRKIGWHRPPPAPTPGITAIVPAAKVIVISV